MKALYVAIVEQIQAELGSDVFVDLWNEQSEDPEYGLFFPAVFLDFSLECRNAHLGSQKQIINLSLEVYCVMQVIGDTHAGSTDDKVLDYLDFLQEVYVALQGFNARGLLRGPLRRTNITRQGAFSHLRAYKISFEAEYYDQEAVVIPQKAQPDIIATSSIQ